MMQFQGLTKLFLTKTATSHHLSQYIVIHLHLMMEQSFEAEKINLSSGDTHRHVTDS